MLELDQNYEEINQILRRVSNRTLEMKTNNVKLLNKIGSEMNVLLAKAQEIVRFCISDRNDFMKEIELIQFDFIELGKKIDKKFSIEKQSNPSQSQKSKSILKTMLDSDNSDNESSNQPAMNNLVVPDTCMPMCDEINTKKPSRQLIIRDTIDSNFEDIFKETVQNKLSTIDENTVINDSLEKEDETKNLDETCMEEEDANLEIPQDNTKKIIPDTSRLNFLRTSQSTPLAIKKKLQEHGLLDLTNSPHESPFKTKKSNSPIKYIQSKFVMESPKNQGAMKTPVKIVLKTPTKSPSIFIKKPSFQPTNEVSNENQEKSFNENQNDSFDFSFEFREQIKTKSKSSNSIKSSSSNMSVFSNSSKSPRPKASLTTNRNNKRLKQLTVSEAFSSNDSANKTENKISSFFTRKDSDKNLVNKNRNDMDETCLNDETFNNIKIKPEPTSYDSNHKRTSNPIKIKNEPASFIENDQYNLKRVPVKNEPRYDSQEDSNTRNEFDNDQTNKDNRNFADEYFNDFDRVPKKKDANQKNFKHVEVVRKHDERKKLPSWSCKECETYWNSVPEDKRPKRMEESCRHRAKYQPPATPEHYWSVAFPTTQECIDRGYGGVVAQNDKDDQISKRPRRKRPLKLIANEDNNDGQDDIRDFDFGD